MKLCPICKKNYMYDNEEYCSNCNYILKLIKNLTAEQLIKLVNMLKRIDTKSTKNTRENFMLTKSEAINILRSNGYEMENYNTTYASKNDTIDIYWANPSYSMLKRNWNLILNDSINRSLYIFKIPAGSGLENRLISRADRTDKIDLQIYYNDFTFTDSRSKISFDKFYVEKVDY